MTVIANFTVRANEAGLPVKHVPRSAFGEESLLGLTSKAVAQLYWMLEWIDVAYSYDINGTVVNRSYRVQYNVEPVKRVYLPPVFNYEGEDEGWGLTFKADFDIWNVYQSKNGSYCLVFHIREYDSNGLFFLTTNPKHPVKEAFKPPSSIKTSFF
ncbi:MAG: hypothetical protein A2007_01295 [Verrucomicrobia bacterium GWC2_42_7]|nr:MAG: hypothetical protein A2007_01295 [Verrucomicrobia bacterium GWC2_42_7]